jgi:XTP/dITP diphosphohydrolase
MKLLVATTNANKVREIRPVLAGAPVELLTLADFPAMDEPEESAATYWQNARLKAFGYLLALQQTHHHSGGGVSAAADIVIAAEDSGLEITGLNGVPGVRSARFLGTQVSYPERFAEIYRRLADLPDEGRRARFVTALCVVRGGEILFETETSIDGTIAPQPGGEHGFGYDPIFCYAPLEKTTAELTIEEKCAVSHRARAFRDFARWLGHAQLT